MPWRRRLSVAFGSSKTTIIALHVDETLINHFISADHVVLIAGDTEMLQVMIDDISQGIMAAEYQWKKDDTVIMPMGDIERANLRCTHMVRKRTSNSPMCGIAEVARRRNRRRRLHYNQHGLQIRPS